MTEQEARERILQATIHLLNEGADPDKITVRQIAEQAEVGVGGINYHYQTRDNLLHEAVSAIMRHEAERWLELPAQPDMDPVEQLKVLFKETTRVSLRYPLLLKVLIEHTVQHGDTTVEMMVMPLLRQIFGDEKPELALRLIAFQLVVPMQVAYLWGDAFAHYAGVSLMDDEQRDALLGALVDNLINS